MEGKKELCFRCHRAVSVTFGIRNPVTKELLEVYCVACVKEDNSLLAPDNSDILDAEEIG